MASQWYTFTDDEAGPFPFGELARLIACGELEPTDLVRRAESGNWQRVDTVLGLMRAARQVQIQPVRHIPHARTGILSRWLVSLFQRIFPRLPAERASILLASGLLAVLPVQLIWFWSQRPVRFPAAPAKGVVIEGTSKLEQMRPAAPRTPSIPNLKIGEPRIVPGFENVPWLKSPTLSADLLTIVYVSYSGPEQLDDLLIASRKSITEPFRNHRPLQQVNSSHREAHPTLSPNGLELIFARLGEPSVLYSARRHNIQAAFGSAIPLKLEGPVNADHHLDSPQFVTDQLIRITEGDQAFQNRSQWRAARTGDGIFRLLQPIALANPWPRYFMTAQGRRAYFPTEEGIQLTAFNPARKLFEAPELCVAASVIGQDLTTFDDTIWVTPAEDVIFFCGPGLHPKNSDSRRLWMIRY